MRDQRAGNRDQQDIVRLLRGKNDPGKRHDAVFFQEHEGRLFVGKKPALVDTVCHHGNLRFDVSLGRPGNPLAPGYQFSAKSRSYESLKRRRVAKNHGRTFPAWIYSWSLRCRPHGKSQSRRCHRGPHRASGRKICRSGIGGMEEGWWYAIPQTDHASATMAFNFCRNPGRRLWLARSDGS